MLDLVSSGETATAITRDLLVYEQWLSLVYSEVGISDGIKEEEVQIISIRKVQIISIRNLGEWPFHWTWTMPSEVEHDKHCGSILS